VVLGGAMIVPLGRLRRLQGIETHHSRKLVGGQLD